MKRSFPIRFSESYLPTPRHKKPRYREVAEDVTVEIPELTLREAPVAFRRTSPFRRLAIDSSYGCKSRIDYHWYDGRLFVPCNLRRFVCLGENERNRPARVTDLSWHDSPSYYSREGALACLDAWVSQFVIIDDRLCEEIGEPRYVVMTFGLGHNHGLGWGTSLSVDHGFNVNIPTDRYWRIDQEQEANEAGWALARRRGDTKAEEHFKKRLYDRFEILIPEAVRMSRAHRTEPVDEFSEKAAAITSAGLPTDIAAFALLAAAVGK